MDNAPLDELRDYAASLADSVASMTTTHAVNAALHGSPSAVPVLRRRIATTGVIVMTFLSGNAGLAWAADSAIPNEALYSIDRAYESLAGSVGIGGDNAQERLEEAAELVRRGDVALALSTAREGVEGISSDLEGSGLAETVASIDMAMEPGPVPLAATEAMEIIEAAHLVSDAAHSGDHASLLEAAHVIKTIALAHAKSNDPQADPEIDGDGNGNGYGNGNGEGNGIGNGNGNGNGEGNGIGNGNGNGNGEGNGVGNGNGNGNGNPNPPGLDGETGPPDDPGNANPPGQAKDKVKEEKVKDQDE